MRTVGLGYTNAWVHPVGGLICLARQVHQVVSKDSHIVLQVTVVVSGWLWNHGIESDAKRPLKEILMLAKKLGLCICIALGIWHQRCFSLCGDTTVESKELHIATGSKTQNCWAYIVRHMERIQYEVAIMWQGELTYAIGDPRRQ